VTILLVHQGVYGQTRRICERLRAELAKLGIDAQLASLAEAGDPGRYDGVVIGASIRNGKHNPAVGAFVERHRAILESKPSAFFSVNLVARKPAKNTIHTNPYLRAFVEKSPWKPKLLGVFAGNLDYQRYGVMDRNIIRFIMWITKGPTDPKTKIEYTNWDEVVRFAGQVAAYVSTGVPPAQPAPAPASPPGLPARAA